MTCARMEDHCIGVDGNSLVEEVKELGDSVRTQRRDAFRIGVLVIPLICIMAAQPGFAKGGKSTGHAYVKSAARPSGTDAKHAPHSENRGQAKTDTAHTSVNTRRR
jgi:hypothetical protein